MKALLVRVGADQSEGGGYWNGPVDIQSGRFVYVAIPEDNTVHVGTEKPYQILEPALSEFGISLPSHLSTLHMHLDPDFSHLTYGDQGERAKQLQANLSSGDMIVFYSGLSDVNNQERLVYAITGVFIVDTIILAWDVPESDRDINAHSRRVLSPGAKDVIVKACPSVSGRLETCLSIGEWRNRAYRVRQDLLEEWGGLTVKDGYLQRSARLPKFVNPARFLEWFQAQNPVLMQANN